MFVNTVIAKKWWIGRFAFAALEVSVCLRTPASWQCGKIHNTVIPALLLYTCSPAVIHVDTLLVIKY